MNTRTDIFASRPQLGQLFLLIVFAGIVTFAWWRGNTFCFSHAPGDHRDHNERAFHLLIIGSSAIVVVGALWRLWLSHRYKPWPLCDDATCPHVSVVVPVYNEGSGVLRTLTSIMESNYPRHKLQLIVVDDGSVDDSAFWIQLFAQKHQNQCVALKLKRNCGKRVALLFGFQCAVGELMVTIDSDCIVDQDAIRRLIVPMVLDPLIGAVAGHVKVLDEDSSVIRRMLSVSFALAFEFSRSAQSVLRCVFCTPGAFSAYRANAVKPILTEWAQQRFLGRPSRIAEDRALTNMILKSGWHTVYQTTAVARTRVPRNLRGLWRMHLRWARGNIRESIQYARMMPGQALSKPSIAANGNFLLTTVNLIAPFPLLLWCLINASQGLSGILNIAAWTVMGSSLVMGWYAYRYRTWNVAYGILYVFFWAFLCSWILPWAAITLRDDRWLTRSSRKSINENRHVKETRLGG